MKKSNIVLSIILIFVLLEGCEDKNEKVFKTELYSSGKIKKTGWYIDTLPVDTLKEYFENGNIASIQWRNSSGKLNGPATYFYDNGNVFQKAFYNNDVLEGNLYIYYSTGTIKQSVFYFNGDTVGDAYFFDSSTQKIETYGFFDFEGRNINLIQWDSSGKMIKDESPYIHFDSVIISKDSLRQGDNTQCKIFVLLSNQPKKSSKVYINYLTKNKEIIKRDSVEKTSMFAANQLMPDSLFYVLLQGVMYDSIKKETYYQSKKFSKSNSE